MPPNNKAVDFALNLPNFRVEKITDEVLKSIRSMDFDRYQAPFTTVLKDLSKALKCDDADVCVIQTRRIQRNNKRIEVISFRYKFNAAVNELLKSTGSASFDKSYTGWNLPVDTDLVRSISEGLSEHFRYVVDSDDQRILGSLSESVHSSKEKIAFGKIPFHLTVSQSDVLSAMKRVYPNDPLIDASLKIHDGTHFIRIPDQDVVWTESPFLLLCISCERSHLRYGVFSTLSNSIDEVIPSNSPRRLAQAIARLRDACETLHIQPFVDSPTSVKLEQSGQRQSMLSEFNKFSSQIDLAKSRLSDIAFAPLLSDYVTLTDVGLGADASSTNLVAYAGNTEHLSRVARFFGYDEIASPIVFSKRSLGEMSGDSDQFTRALAHELAHGLLERLPGGRYSESDSHGVRWSIASGILETALVGSFLPSTYSEKHAESKFTQFVINSVLQEVTQNVAKDIPLSFSRFACLFESAIEGFITMADKEMRLLLKVVSDVLPKDDPSAPG